MDSKADSQKSYAIYHHLQLRIQTPSMKVKDSMLNPTASPKSIYQNCKSLTLVLDLKLNLHYLAQVKVAQLLERDHQDLPCGEEHQRRKRD